MVEEIRITDRDHAREAEGTHLAPTQDIGRLTISLKGPGICCQWRKIWVKRRWMSASAPIAIKILRKLAQRQQQPKIYTTTAASTLWPNKMQLPLSTSEAVVVEPRTEHRNGAIANIVKGVARAIITTLMTIETGMLVQDIMCTVWTDEIQWYITVEIIVFSTKSLHSIQNSSLK